MNAKWIINLSVTLLFLVVILFVLMTKIGSINKISRNIVEAVMLRRNKVHVLTREDQFLEVKPHACIRSMSFGTGNVSTIICAKSPKSDRTVSATIIKNGAWEPQTVAQVVETLEKLPGAVLLDVGSNIGMFTTIAAAMGRKVTAVDADLYNLSFIRKSLEVLGNSRNVKLINNAVGDTYSKLYPVQWGPGNEAYQPLFTEEYLKETNRKPHRVGPLIETVKMQDILDEIEEDLLVLKIDIESYECKALQYDILLGRSGKTIPIVFIEWSVAGTLKRLGNCPNYEEWVDTWYEGTYVPFAGKRTLQRNELDKHRDLVWILKSYIPKLL